MKKNSRHTLVEISTSFLVLGCTAFGGPMAHIAYFRQFFVTQKRWLSEEDFAQLLSLCQLLPGPASSQLGFAIGLLRSGWLGALLAFISFTLPSVILLMLFASLVLQLDPSMTNMLLSSLTLVAVVVVAQAVIGMATKFCTTTSTRSIAVLAFAFIVSGWLPFANSMVIVIGGMLGYCFCRTRSQANTAASATPCSKKTGSVCLVMFSVLLIWSLSPQDSSTLRTLAGDFYQVGAMVFGGGHVVLPLLTEVTVSNGLVSETDFFAGYGAAQALPGPLFSVAAYYGGIGIDASNWSWLGAFTATVAIFLPGFLLLAGVLPWWQSVMQFRAMQTAICGINAAVVGLLAATWLDPLVSTSIHHWHEVLIALAGLVLLQQQRLPTLPVIILFVLANGLALFIM